MEEELNERNVEIIENIGTSAHQKDFSAVSKNYTKIAILICSGFLVLINIILPITLEYIDFGLKITVLSSIGISLIYLGITTTFIDFYLLVFKKQNRAIVPFFSMTISLSMFLLVEYFFIKDFFYFDYILKYSEIDLNIIYKIFAIWVGQDGSILTWILLNSVVIAFFRIKNQEKEDIVFLRSVIISTLVSMVFLFILLFSDMFKVFPGPIDGSGLNPMLRSPFMIWHPLFIFIAYAVFLIPFTVTIAEVLSGNSKLSNNFQRKYYDFSLKFGWLIITLGIGLGAYWAKITQNWGAVYWSWDPVEGVSLIPWFLGTAFFHSRAFKKKRPGIIQMNIILIFLSIVFSTLITRGGGLNSQHSFAGNEELVFYVVVIGSFLMISTLYVIYNLLNYIIEEYKQVTVLFEYLCYFFLFLMAFITTLGLLIPPLTYILSLVIPTVIPELIYIDVKYFSTVNLIPAAGLAVSLIFCSLISMYKFKKILTILVVGILVQTGVSFLILSLTNFWLNPVVVIYLISTIAAVLELIKNSNLKRGILAFYKRNSRVLIHLGISILLLGTILNMEIIQDVIYIGGFSIIMIGITPSLILSFYTKKMIRVKSR